MVWSVYARRGFRRATAPWRPLPGVLGIGAMRCGTSALYVALSRHPDVGAPSRKEIQFFDINHHRGPSWYRAFFPVGPTVSIDFSPSYMNHPEAASRAFELVPKAKVIALLRDPAERAWSQYRLRKSIGTEQRSFEEAIEIELAQPVSAFNRYPNAASIPYLAAGLYASQLEQWIGLFGPDNVLVVDSADLFSDPIQVLSEVQQFIGVDHVELTLERVNSAPSRELPHTYSRVEAFFDEPNARLTDLLGRRFSWM